VDFAPADSKLLMLTTHSALASSNKIKIQKRVHSKPKQRGAAETSLRSCTRVTITRLTEENISTSIEDGMVVLKVPGLCVSGGNNPHADQVGHVVLL
jgi:hypothetical protein